MLKRSLLQVHFRRLVDKINDNLTDFEGLNRLLGVFINKVVGLNESEFFVLKNELQFVNPGN
jgi:hypothetical protein